MFPQDVFLDHELDNEDQKVAAPDKMMIARVLMLFVLKSKSSKGFFTNFAS